MPSITCSACKAVLNSSTPVPAGRMQVTLIDDELTLRELSPGVDPEGVKFTRISK
jgi:hypothetical protein